jgi:hypothetical protein
MPDDAGSASTDGYAANVRALELSDCEAGVEANGRRAARPVIDGDGSRVHSWWPWRRERRLLAWRRERRQLVPPGRPGPCTAWARVQLRRRLPCLVWLPLYSRQLFFTDVSTGITVGVVLIPQVRGNHETRRSWPHEFALRPSATLC